MDGNSAAQVRHMRLRLRELPLVLTGQRRAAAAESTPHASQF
jgi:hypothetical protein